MTKDHLKAHLIHFHLSEQGSPGIPFFPEKSEKSFNRLRNKTIINRLKIIPAVMFAENAIQMRINPPINVMNLRPEIIINSFSSFFSRSLNDAAEFR